MAPSAIVGCTQSRADTVGTQNAVPLHGRTRWSAPTFREITSGAGSSFRRKPESRESQAYSCREIVMRPVISEKKKTLCLAIRQWHAKSHEAKRGPVDHART